MEGSSRLDSALSRMSSALRDLEASVDRRLKSDRTVATLHEEVQHLGDDRAQMAEALDAATARSERLEAANRDVSRRLVTAMETIRSVLEGHGG
ncbi:MAG: DUF4164 domain-containing protein [Stappiaceae bacterium]